VMRVMPRLQKLVSSVRSGRNHCGRVVGNPSLTRSWKGSPLSSRNRCGKRRDTDQLMRSVMRLPVNEKRAQTP